MNIEINGVTLQADFMDVDFMELFEPALYQMLDKIRESKSQNDKSVASGYRDINNCVENFFNSVWGENASGRIFSGSKNVMVHLEAVEKVNGAFRSERKQFNDFSNKYTQRQKDFQSMQGHQGKGNHQDKHI